jgi:hypothetical protein
MPVPRLVGLREGPARLVIARHAQSVGNVPDEKARESGAARLDLDARDADVELSRRVVVRRMLCAFGSRTSSPISPPRSC